MIFYYLFMSFMVKTMLFFKYSIILKIILENTLNLFNFFYFNKKLSLYTLRLT